MKKLSFPFLIVLFVTGALVHKGLAKKGSFLLAKATVPQLDVIENPISSKKEPETALINDQRSFSIHKIVNSSIHYELHIQKDNILETWKIYKGPSCNPLHQRKASKQKDVPLDYLLFEGTLSKGKMYKEGILVWDYGTYTFHKQPTPTCYTLIFSGKRIKGLYTLEKKHNNWMLTKEQDTFSDTHKNITRLFTRSAVSGLTLTQILHGLKPD